MSPSDSAWNPFSHRPLFAPDDVGGTFLDLLFAVVVAQVFTEIVGGGNSGPRLAQLVLAGLVTLTSWLGYHQSRGGTPFQLEYFNLPLLQFVVHLGLVVVFFLLAARSEAGPPGAGQAGLVSGQAVASAQVSARPESVLMCIAFALYIAWEVSSYVVWHNDAYVCSLPNEVFWQHLASEPPVKLAPTVVFAVLAAIATAVVLGWDPHQSSVVVAIDVAWMVFIVAHRYAQGVANRGRRAGR